MEFVITCIKNISVYAMVVVGMVTMPSYYFEAKDLVKGITQDTFKPAQTTLAFDIDGNVITKLKDDKESYYLSYDSIPESVRDAFVSTEDKNFFDHVGVDIVGVGRALVKLIKNGEISGGGSTITQQLARNIFLTHEQSFERKAKEIFIAYFLEKESSKEQILEYYINSIYFANGSYGIDSASRKYFNKSATELTLAESAYLVAIPNNPTLYNPFLNHDNTIKRQKRVLGYMLEDGNITQDEYEGALSSEIKVEKEESKSSKYVDTYIIDNTLDILMKLDGFETKTEFSSDEDKKEYNELYSQYRKDAQVRLYGNGYRIHTSFDMAKQEALQKSIDDNYAVYTDVTKDGTYSFQGSAVSIDNETGQVVAMVGGRSQDGIPQSYNRAFKSFRQPGSIIKPLLSYTPMFDHGYYPNTVVEDIKGNNGPKNLYDIYDGISSIRYAVEESKNTVAWNMFKELGVEKGLQYLKEMNFEKIHPNDYNLAASLGGLTYGTNTLEMAAAYSTLARDGKYIAPSCIIKITDADGKVLYENDNKENLKEIYSERSSRIMTDILRTTMINGTGAVVQLNDMTSAGKTGSTNQSKDGWFAGYTPYYTTVVWAGHDTPKPVEDLYGSTYPGRAWKQYMDAIHVGMEDKGFDVYEPLSSEQPSLQGLSEYQSLEYSIRSEIDSYGQILINSYDSAVHSENIYSSIVAKIFTLNDEKKIAKYKRNLDIIRNKNQAKRESMGLLK